MSGEHSLDTYLRLYEKASVKKRNGNIREAIYLFDFITQTKDLIADAIRGGAFYHLGEIYMSLKEKEKARSSFDSCLQQIPDHGKALERKIALSNEVENSIC